MERFLGILVAAVPVGSVYALAAAGLVLTYRTSRVFNFAHGAVGMFSAFLFHQLWVGWGVPLPLALIAVVAGLAPAMGVVLDVLVFRHLRDAPTSVKIVVTVGLLVGLQGLAGAIWGGAAVFLPGLLPGGSLPVFGDLRLGYDRLLMLGISLGTLVGLGVLLRSTSFGLRVRASVDRPDLAELAGVDTARVSAASWALGFATAAVSGILLSPILGLDTFILTLFVIQAFAAALFGRLSSFPLTLAGGLLVAGLEEMSGSLVPAGCDVCLAVRPAVPFAVIFGLLAYGALVPRSRMGRWVRAGTGEPSAPPPRPLPRARRRGWIPAVGLVAGLAGAAPFLATDWLLRVERGLAMAGVFAGLVVLAGLSGQISLAHTAFAGTGAFVTAALSAHGVPFVPAVALAGAAVVPVAVFVALPAIRLQGLHVALLTLGFALVVAKFFESGLTGGTAGMEAARPSFARSDLAFFYLLLGLAALLFVAARNLHRSPSGRVLAAIRDSEVAARSIGVPLPLYRLAAFALSGFMAGVAGGALAGFQGIVTFNDFHPLLSLVWLSVAVIGGLGSAWGAVVAAGLWAVGSTAVGTLAQLGFGAGAMLLARSERGLAGLAGGLRERLSGLSATLGRAAAIHDGWPEAAAPGRPVERPPAVPREEVRARGAARGA